MSSTAPPSKCPARAHFRRFIGVDLGGGRGKNTAVARLELQEDGQGATILRVVEARSRQGQRGTGPGEPLFADGPHFRDEVLVQYLTHWVDDDTVVAINAPLTLPPCIRCQLACPGSEACTVPQVAWMRTWAGRLRVRGRSDPAKPTITPYTQRATEILVGATGVVPREALGQGTGPVAARGAYLRRRLSPLLRMHDNLLEVQSQATLVRLFGPRAARKAHHGDQAGVWEQRKRILGSLADSLAFAYVWPELVVRNVHGFQALVCAATAYLWASQGWVGPGDLLPPAPEPDATPMRSGEAGDGASSSPAPLSEAVSALGHDWVESGWIWMPPLHMPRLDGLV